jgi:hypothetical protein
VVGTADDEQRPQARVARRLRHGAAPVLTGATEISWGGTLALKASHPGAARLSVRLLGAELAAIAGSQGAAQVPATRLAPGANELTLVALDGEGREIAIGGSLSVQLQPVVPGDPPADQAPAGPAWLTVGSSPSRPARGDSSPDWAASHAGGEEALRLSGWYHAEEDGLHFLMLAGKRPCALRLGGSAVPLAGSPDAPNAPLLLRRGWYRFELDVPAAKGRPPMLVLGRDGWRHLPLDALAGDPPR